MLLLKMGPEVPSRSEKEDGRRPSEFLVRKKLLIRCHPNHNIISQSFVQWAE